MAAIPPSTRSGLMALSRHYARPGAAVHLVQRSLATAATASTTRTAAAPASALLSRQQCRSRPGMLSASPAARRGYADIAKPDESTPQQQQQQQQSQSKQQQKKKKAGFFRWMWRLTVLTTIGMGGGLVYGIYSGNTPQEQMVPDPTKKTLVILVPSPSIANDNPPNMLHPGSGWGAVSLIKKLDTENYNVIVISPRNFFLFTPLLPSCTTGMIEHRSIMEPIRSILRHKKASVMYYEAEATKIDYDSKVVHMTSNSEVTGDTTTTQVPFDMLVVGVGAENATFGGCPSLIFSSLQHDPADHILTFPPAGIKGVKEHSCFLKEVGDAQRIRKRIMDCVETAMFKDQSPEEIKRLLHMVVVGGGPTGVEFAGELQDFFNQDLRKWIPEIKDNFRVTLVEALPNLGSCKKTLRDPSNPAPGSREPQLPFALFLVFSSAALRQNKSNEIK
ncbi:NADH:ubiquinone oxidoreductase [Ascosphaera atra]|nr:NADH:ubiquinone oxidoreductase [Ascosphaera atra]